MSYKSVLQAVEAARRMLDAEPLDYGEVPDLGPATWPMDMEAHDRERHERGLQEDAAQGPDPERRKHRR